MMNSGIIFKIKKYAIHDGPGIRTTIFLKGCSLDCWWCHNPEGKMPKPQVMKADHSPDGKQQAVGKKMSVEEVISEIEKDIIFYDESGGGVTFSGGEPLLQAPFLLAMLKACQEKQIHTVVDTSGYAPDEVFIEICNMIDVVLFDLKLMDDEMHRRYTGVSNKKILKNLNILSKLRTPHHIRFPLIPGITDTDENVLSVAKFVRELGSVSRIDILPMHRIADGKYRRLGMQSKMANKQPPSPDEITTIKRQFEDFGFSVIIGG
ncbi:MAG: glycyl-radical enzyme activating protein [Desulfobacterales bacterium]|nr:MAG: glycyl-radical enzyme activating protein [Desulfobacterales bacterium]